MRHASSGCFIAFRIIRQDVQTIMSSDDWRNLPAVRNGLAYVVGAKWAMYDPPTLEAHLDEMVRLLRSAP